MEKRTYRPFARILGAFFFMGALVSFLGCTAKPLQGYSTRGLVVSVEQGAAGDSLVTILHEAIPEFKDRTGKTVGMDPMVMTFAADASVSTKHIQPQSKIKFLFEVDWESAQRLILKQIQPLGAETTLELQGYSAEMG